MLLNIKDKGSVSEGIKASVTHFITPPTCQGVILKKRQTKVGFSVITGKNAENNHFSAVKKKFSLKNRNGFLSSVHFDYITLTQNNPLQSSICWPCLLEKCWKTSEQDTLTTWPTSARSQQWISSHSVLQPERHQSKRRQSTLERLQSISPAKPRMQKSSTIRPCPAVWLSFAFHPSSIPFNLVTHLISKFLDVIIPRQGSQSTTMWNCHPRRDL